MSIRLQQLLLLLGIALLPIAISGWYSLLQINQMAADIEESTVSRAHFEEKAKELMRAHEEMKETQAQLVMSGNSSPSHCRVISLGFAACAPTTWPPNSPIMS